MLALLGAHHILHVSRIRVKFEDKFILNLNLLFKSANFPITVTLLIKSLFLNLPGATEYNNETKTEPTLRFGHLVLHQLSSVKELVLTWGLHLGLYING